MQRESLSWQRSSIKETKIDMETEKDQDTEQSDTNNHPDFKIPEQIMREAVGFFVIGIKRSEIAERFLAQSPIPDWLHPIAHLDTSDQKTVLSSRLRQADPSSLKYAETKYRQYENNYRAALFQTVNREVEALVMTYLQDAIENNPSIQKTLKTLKKKILDAIKDGLIELDIKIPTNTDE